MLTHLRLCGAITLIAFLPSCSSNVTGGASSGSSGGTSSGGTSSGGTSSGTSGSPAETPAGLDGTWDITSAGGDGIAPSSLTIDGGKIDGVIIYGDEGKTVGDGCRYSKHRLELKLSVNGNSLSGDLTSVREYTGSQSCSDNDEREAVPVTGSRPAGASGATALEGAWEVRFDDGKPFSIDVTGLTAKAWDPGDKAKGRDPGVHVSVSGRNATVTATTDEHGFAARKK